MNPLFLHRFPHLSFRIPHIEFGVGENERDWMIILFCFVILMGAGAAVATHLFFSTTKVISLPEAPVVTENRPHYDVDRARGISSFFTDQEARFEELKKKPPVLGSPD